MATFLLYESASGYALFEGLDMDEIGQTAEAVQETITCVESAAPFFPLAGRNNSPIVGPRSRARAFVRPGDPNERRRDRCTVAQSRGSFGIQARALLRTANPSSRRGEGRKCTPLFRFVGGLRRCRRAATGFPVTFFGESVSPSLDPRDHLLTFPPTPLRSQ